MKFLLAAELPARLANAMVRAGRVTWHVYDCGLLAAKDRDIWKFARAEGAAVVTTDGDFAAMRMQAGEGPPVVWLRLGCAGSEVLEKSLLSALPKVVAAIAAGEDVVEVQ